MSQVVGASAEYTDKIIPNIDTLQPQIPKIYKIKCIEYT